MQNAAADTGTPCFDDAPLLTVFTPTYNRAGTLGDCYRSLIRQTSRQFIWIVVDDGSQDNTRECVRSWIDEGKIAIEYYYKPNGGMHTGHNLAFEKAATELVCCLDSDDELAEDAVEVIIRTWKEHNDGTICGIAALEAYRSTGETIGTEFPDKLTRASFYDLYYKYGVSGDKLLVYKTESIRPHPYPEFPGERFVPLDCKYLAIDEPLWLLPRKLYIKEYLQDGYTRNIFRAYARSPKGFIYYRRLLLELNISYRMNVKSCVHYVAESLLCGQKRIVSDSPRRLLTALFYPLGFVVFLKIRKVKNLKNNPTTV